MLRRSRSGKKRGCHGRHAIASAVSGLVWMKDAKAERSLERAVPPEALSSDSPAVFAIRATDVLHGGLLELGYPRPGHPKAWSRALCIGIGQRPCPAAVHGSPDAATQVEPTSAPSDAEAEAPTRTRTGLGIAAGATVLWDLGRAGESVVSRGQ